MPFGVNKRDGSHLPTFGLIFGLSVLAGFQSVRKVSGLLEQQPLTDTHVFARACLGESVRRERTDNLKPILQYSDALPGFGWQRGY